MGKEKMKIQEKPARISEFVHPLSSQMIQSILQLS